MHDMGAEHVLIKGGHVADTRRKPPKGTGKPDAVIDFLFDGHTFLELRVPRARGRSGTRGTGCVHASALAAFLALGHDLRTAAARAQRHVARLIGRTYTG
jgi:hydroxymethylpyrimidine/phosphomethylpyrimidine kinase